MLGSPQIRQHHIEFIRGQGVLLDGVLIDGSTPNGPWTWVVPEGAFGVELDGCGAGGGGGAGRLSGTSRAGGGGGSSGASILGLPLQLSPGTSVAVTVGAGAAGGQSEGSNGGVGGDTLLDCPTLRWGTSGFTANRIKLPGGLGGNAASASASGAGAAIANSSGGGAAVSNAASPTAGVAGAIGSATSTFAKQRSFGARWTGFFGGSSGGAASTAATTAGAVGGRSPGSVANTALNHLEMYMTTSTGSQDGTASYAGGGFGGWSLFGQAGIGGNGVATSDSNGRNAANFGGGGGGGGGSTTGFGKGGSGSDGFVRIRYKVIE